MNRRSRFGFATLFAVCVTTLGSLFLLSSSDGSARQVVTTPVDRQDVVRRVRGTGRLRAGSAVEVSAETSGKVARLAVAEGDRVERGQLLLEMDSVLAEERVHELRAAVERARLEEALAAAERAEGDLELERKRRLFAAGLIALEDLEAAETSAAVRRLRGEAIGMDVLRLGAALRGAEHELRKARVRSGIDGVVSRINIEEGENAFVGNFGDPATVLMEIVDLTVVEAVVEVDETDVAAVRVGQPAGVELDSLPGRSFRAVVAAVGRSPLIRGESDAWTTRFEVVLRLAEEVPDVRPGLTCEAEVTTEVRRDVLVVPLQAVVEHHGGGAGAPPAAAFVLDGGAARRVTVELGLADDRWFEVVGGLDEGDEVVTGPYEVLRVLSDGEPLRSGRTR